MAFADELFECFDHIVGLAVKGLTTLIGILKSSNTFCNKKPIVRTTLFISFIPNFWIIEGILY